MTTQERIEHKFSTADFFGNSGPEDLLDIDFDKSIERYAELLVEDISAEYPDAKINVEWTAETLPHDKTFIEPWEYLTTEYDDVMSDIQRIKEDLYGDFDRWLVPGFNTDAWTEKAGRDADKANTGDILTVTVGKAGPMESQDAMVEIVVLDGGCAERSVVAYRYSTASQDDDWQLGTIEQAVERAEECYRAIKDAEQHDA